MAYLWIPLLWIPLLVLLECEGVGVIILTGGSDLEAGRSTMLCAGCSNLLRSPM